jgi:hypothetical protein
MTRTDFLLAVRRAVVSPRAIHGTASMLAATTVIAPSASPRTVLPPPTASEPAMHAANRQRKNNQYASRITVVPTNASASAPHAAGSGLSLPITTKVDPAQTKATIRNPTPDALSGRAIAPAAPAIAMASRVFGGAGSAG